MLFSRTSRKFNVTIDTLSVDTGYPLFNEHIQGADFLDTAKYPIANFTSSKVNFDGAKISSVEGMLTLKGISKPVPLFSACRIIFNVLFF